MYIARFLRSTASGLVWYFQNQSTTVQRCRLTLELDTPSAVRHTPCRRPTDMRHHFKGDYLREVEILQDSVGFLPAHHKQTNKDHMGQSDVSVFLTRTCQKCIRARARQRVTPTVTSKNGTSIFTSCRKIRIATAVLNLLIIKNKLSLFI